jgi:CP family cyanate transporter-like MFS transporter
VTSDTPTTPAAGHARALLVAGVVLVAINLRPSIAAVGPLVSDIRADTGLSSTALGLLTTLPLLAFGAVSTLTPLVIRRIGIERAVALALALIGVGTAARAAPAVALLFLGTGVMGVGIALGNVLLPALAKRDFPRHTGPMTSLYSSVMGLGATIAAGVSAPLALTLGWRPSLGSWAVLAVAALVAWIPITRRRLPIPGSRRRGSAFRTLGRSRLAWQVALFMGFQSLTFYVILAWLPDLLHDRGLPITTAGWLLALSQATGVLGTAVVPLYAGRLADQRRIVWALGISEALALAGLLLPALGPTTVWVALIGFVLGGTFGLALLLLVLRAPDAEIAGELSGMAQSIGYLVAAVGPTAFGFLHDLTAGWEIPLLFLAAVLAGKVWTGVGAARAGVVEAAPA